MNSFGCPMVLSLSAMLTMNEKHLIQHKCATISRCLVSDLKMSAVIANIHPSETISIGSAFTEAINSSDVSSEANIIIDPPAEVINITDPLSKAINITDPPAEVINITDPPAEAINITDPSSLNIVNLRTAQSYGNITNISDKDIANPPAPVLSSRKTQSTEISVSPVITIQDPASQKLKWQNAPLTVLVVKKMFDDSVVLPFTDLVSWLIEEKKMIVYIEHKVKSDPLLLNDVHFNCLTEKLKTFAEGDDLTGKVDFIICLGGDGTLLHASSLFQESVPPVMAFHLGSLGFLTPFEFINFREQVTQVLEGNAALTLRSRLKCVVSKETEALQSLSRNKKDNSYSCAEILVLNEVVIDRGPCPYLCNLDLYIEGRLVTSVQGDGLIVSTPTGSTAYAVAAGASMMHPNVPAIMITPICPHSLSFRPIVVPAGVEIKLLVSPEARNSAWVSFDGRNRQEIHQGDSVRITTARYPVPSVCKTDQIDDWFNSLAECLHWNVRKAQLPLSSRNSTATLDSDTESNHSSR